MQFHSRLSLLAALLLVLGCTDLGSGRFQDAGQEDQDQLPLADSLGDDLDENLAQALDAGVDQPDELPDTWQGELPSDLDPEDLLATDGGWAGDGGLDDSATPSDAGETQAGDISEPACVPDCRLRDCGDDGCGGSCGDCRGQLCDEFHGLCLPRPSSLVVGRLMFELRYPEYDSGGGLALMGPKPYPAAGLPVLAQDARGRLLARGEVSERGFFRLQLPRAPLEGDLLLFPCVWSHSPLSTQADFAIARPPSGGSPRALVADPWVFQAALPPDGDAGTITITEADGAAAVNIFIEARFAFLELQRHLPEGLKTRTQSLAIFWGPAIPWNCGACFASTLPQVVGGAGFKTSIFFSDDGSGSTAYCDGTILHEIGHHMAYSHFRDDSRGGSHYLGEKLHPAFAWSEGFASFFAIAMQSFQYGQAYPVLWQINGGSSFWMDYSRMIMGFSGGYGAYIDPPDPGDDFKQYLGEDFVTAALWDYFDGASVAELEDPPDGIALDAAGIFRAASSRRFMVLDRGAHGADLLDFIDASICSHPDQALAIRDMVIGHLGFPYGGLVLCN